MRLHLAASTAVAFLILTSASFSSADKGKGKGKDSSEVSTNFNKQFEWEQKVVGPKSGLDKDRVAAIQEQGRREEEARKKEPPKKQERAKGVDAPATEALPTMDIEKPAAPPPKKQKKVVAEAPKQRDALDNLLDEQGVKPHTPPSGGDGLGSLLASGNDRSSSSSHGGKKSKKSRSR
jgi:hypothetical protein